MKKKCFLFFVFLMMVTYSVKSQEIIALGGYGYNQSDSLNKGEYGFGEIRLMFPLTEALRAGLYGAYVAYGDLKGAPSVLVGKELKYGISLDSYGPLSYSFSYYAWVNTGIDNASDKYQETWYRSLTRTNLLFVSGGLSISDEWSGWFGHNQLMFSYQKPIGTPKVTNWKGEALNSEPYNKEALRINLKTGIKSFGKIINFEPVIRAGYRRNFGENLNLYELGGGLRLGVNRDWNREVLELSVYQTDDFTSRSNYGKRLNIELTLNATSLYYSLKIKK